MADSPGLVDRLYVEIGANTAPLMAELRTAREQARTAVRSISRETGQASAANLAAAAHRARAGLAAGGDMPAMMAGGLLGQNVSFGSVLRAGAAIHAVRSGFDVVTGIIEAFHGDRAALRDALDSVTFGVFGAGERLGMALSGQTRKIKKEQAAFQEREEYVRQLKVVTGAEVAFKRLVADEEAKAYISGLRGDEAKLAEIENETRKALASIDDTHAQLVALYVAAGRDVGIVDELAERARDAIRSQADNERRAISSAVSIGSARVSVPGQFSSDPLIPELLKQIARHTAKETPKYFYSNAVVNNPVGYRP